MYANDGMVWMSQNQLAELFDTSVPNTSTHISNILKECELAQDSVVKNYLSTAADGKEYDVTFYALYSGAIISASLSRVLSDLFRCINFSFMK